MLRKTIIAPASSAQAHAVKPGTKNIPELATVMITSETADHPVDHVFDGHDGPGGTRWVASQDGEQVIVLAFDAPQTIQEVSLETEERHTSRTQVLTLALSSDGGESYREVLRQEFNFSPPGTTFQRESWAVPAAHVTHIRLVVQPDKGHAPCRATLTSLRVR